MKRARPKDKKRAKKRIENRVETNDVLLKNRETAEGNIYEAEAGSYDEIIDAIKREKSEKHKTVSAKKGKRPKKNTKKVLLAVIAVLIFLFIAVMGMDLFDDTDILVPLENGKINILMLGVDESGLRTDAIMVASYDVNEGEVSLLSIPRDTKIYITDKKITRKINAVHALSSDNEKGKILGVQASAEAVTQLTGIPINYYVEFSFLSIDSLFDSLGGVEYDVPDIEGKGRGMNYDDPYQNLHIHLKPGMQTLTGNQVQQFLRYRKSNYGVGTGSDTDRVKRQQEFIKAVLDQKLNMALLPKIPGIFSQLSKEIKTNISMSDVTKYIRYLNKISSENMQSFSLPGENKTISGASYFVCDLLALKTLISENFDVDKEPSDKITLSGKNPHKPLVAGNMKKNTSSVESVTSAQPKSEETNKKEEIKEESPKKEEKTEEKEEKKEEDIPEIPPNSTPLEEIYNLDD